MPDALDPRTELALGPIGLLRIIAARLREQAPEAWERAGSVPDDGWIPVATSTHRLAMSGNYERVTFYIRGSKVQP